MDEEKFKLALSAPVDKNGIVIKLTISMDDAQILSIHHYPEFTWYIILGAFAVFGGSFLLFLISPLSLIYVGIFLLVMLYNISQERALICVIDKNKGVISYHRSGILMTSLDEQKNHYNISAIKHLEMHRYVKGSNWSWSLLASDTFQIFLLLDKGERIPLSPSNLDFSECQEFTQKIGNFLGSEIPIKAFD